MQIYILLTEWSSVVEHCCAAFSRLLCGLRTSGSSRRKGLGRNSALGARSWIHRGIEWEPFFRSLISVRPYTRREGSRSGQVRGPSSWWSLFSCTSPCSVGFPPVAVLGRELGVESSELANGGRSWCRQRKWLEGRLTRQWKQVHQKSYRPRGVAPARSRNQTRWRWALYKLAW